MQGSGPKETASYLRVRCLSFVQFARMVSEIPGAVSEIVLVFLFKVNKKEGKQNGERRCISYLRSATR